MTDKFTPGPWQVANPKDELYSRKVGSAPNGSSIAFCDSFPLEEAQANARLIAAAPELLDACRLAMRGRAGAKLAARAAVIKATGADE